MQEVIYNGGGGVGMILDANELEETFIKSESVTIVDSILIPGELTDFFGWFTKPIRFCGLRKNSEYTIMVFYTGEKSDLFSGKKYYYCFYKIDEYRIYNQFSNKGGGRDFNWVNGKWK